MSDSRSESLTRRIWGATWRIGAFILLFALCMTPLVFPLTRLATTDGGGFGPQLQAMFDGAGLLAILAASAIMVLAVDRRPFSALGLGPRGFPVNLALGALLGAVMIALADSPDKNLTGKAFLQRVRLAASSCAQAAQALKSADLIYQRGEGSWAVLDPLIESALGNSSSL